MTTTSHQIKVQRSRFAQHAFFALTSRLSGRLRPALTPRSASTTASRSEQAALEAREVREMAMAYAHTDPGFASDLYAAAARHEGLYAD